MRLFYAFLFALVLTSCRGSKPNLDCNDPGDTIRAINRDGSLVCTHSFLDSLRRRHHAVTGISSVSSTYAVITSIPTLKIEILPSRDGGITIGPISSLGNSLTIERSAICRALGMIDASGDHFDQEEHLVCLAKVPMLDLSSAILERPDLAHCVRENADTLRCTLAWGKDPRRISFEWLYSMDPKYIEMRVSGSNSIR